MIYKIRHILLILIFIFPLYSNDISFIIQPYGWEEEDGYAVVNIEEYRSAVESSCTIQTDKILFNKEELTHISGNLFTLNREYILDFSYAIEHIPFIELEDSFIFLSDDIVCLFIVVNKQLNKISYVYEETPYDASPLPSQRLPDNKNIYFFPNKEDTIYSIADAIAEFNEDPRIDSLVNTYESSSVLNFEITNDIEFYNRSENPRDIEIGEKLGTLRWNNFDIRLTQYLSGKNILPIIIYESDIKQDISRATINVYNDSPDRNIQKNNTSKVGIVNDSRVRVRTEPNLESSTVGYLNKGDIVYILDSTKDSMVIDNMESVWFQIEYGDDLFGWSFGFFIDVVVK